MSWLAPSMVFKCMARLIGPQSVSSISSSLAASESALQAASTTRVILQHNALLIHASSM
jgi:hypothetical protein